MTSPLRSYVDEHGDLPADLGRIVLFTISDSPVSRSSLERSFDELDLDKAFLPPANKYLHAFEKATSGTKDVYPLSGGRTAFALCRNVSTARDVITRQITREIRDDRRRQLSYGEVITICFYPPSNTANQASARLVMRINPDHLDPEEVPWVQGMARAIKERYDRYFDFLDGQKVRAMVRSYLRHLNSIEIKGGVYFIHANRDEELSRLAVLVNRLGGCQMDQIPIVDLDTQREFITRAFRREADQALQELTTDIRELASTSKRVTTAAYTKIEARFDGLTENVTEHTLKLGTNQDITAASAEIAANLAALQQTMLNQPPTEMRKS